MRKLDRDEQRDKIARVAASLIGSHGVKQVSLQDIATASGGTKGKILHYFDSKEEIVEAAFAWANQRGLDRLQVFFKRDPAKLTVEVNDLANLLPLDEETDLEWRVKLHYREYVLTDPDLMQQYYEQARDQLEVIVETVKRFQQQGYVRADIDPQETAYTAYDMMSGLGFSLLYYPYSERYGRIAGFVSYIRYILDAQSP